MNRPTSRVKPITIFNFKFKIFFILQRVLLLPER